MGRYSNTAILKNPKGIRYYLRNTYVEIPRSNDDVYVITTEEDRYDLLALQYYNDPSYWWIISSANPEYIGSMYPPSGTQIRIPSNVAFVLKSLNLNG